MKDADVVKLARRIDNLNDSIIALIQQIGDSEHPNAQLIFEALQDQIAMPASAVAVVHSRLAEPERWQMVDGDLKGKRGSRIGVEPVNWQHERMQGTGTSIPAENLRGYQATILMSNGHRTRITFWARNHHEAKRRYDEARKATTTIADFRKALQGG